MSRMKGGSVTISKITLYALVIGSMSLSLNVLLLLFMVDASPERQVQHTFTTKEHDVDRVVSNTLVPKKKKIAAGAPLATVKASPSPMVTDRRFIEDGDDIETIIFLDERIPGERLVDRSIPSKLPEVQKDAVRDVYVNDAVDSVPETQENLFDAVPVASANLGNPTTTIRSDFQDEPLSSKKSVVEISTTGSEEEQSALQSVLRTAVSDIGAPTGCTLWFDGCNFCNPSDDTGAWECTTLQCTASGPANCLEY